MTVLKIEEISPIRKFIWGLLLKQNRSQKVMGLKKSARKLEAAFIFVWAHLRHWKDVLTFARIIHGETGNPDFDAGLTKGDESNPKPAQVLAISHHRSKIVPSFVSPSENKPFYLF